MFKITRDACLIVCLCVNEHLHMCTQKRVKVFLCIQSGDYCGFSLRDMGLSIA